MSDMLDDPENHGTYVDCVIFVVILREKNYGTFVYCVIEYHVHWIGYWKRYELVNICNSVQHFRWTEHIGKFSISYDIISQNIERSPEGKHSKAASAKLIGYWQAQDIDLDSENICYASIHYAIYALIMVYIFYSFWLKLCTWLKKKKLLILQCYTWKCYLGIDLTSSTWWKKLINNIKEYDNNIITM